MTKLTKSLTLLGVLGVGAGVVINSGLVDVGNLPAFYVALPFGAIFLGLALISKLLEKESAVYDQEQRANMAAANRAGTVAAPRPCCSVPQAHESIAA